MPPADEMHELDDRFPTGEWTGFFLQPDSHQRYVMNCHLEFARDSISGGGDDLVGEFSIRGAYSTENAECSWTKQYIGQHAVEYTGQARARGIIGQWRIRGTPTSWTGPFFVWPRACGDLSAAFERAFLEYDLSDPIATALSDSAESVQ